MSGNKTSETSIEVVKEATSSAGKTQIEISKPDPTFLKNDDVDLRQPLGLDIEARQESRRETGETPDTTPPKSLQELRDDARQPRLSRKEFETLLDRYYDKRDHGDDHNDGELKNDPHHARIAGGRMVRNLALASSLALFLGFGLGLYGLSQQGGETQIGQQFNKTLAGLWQQMPLVQTSKAVVPQKPVATRSGKPIKTASLVVEDASGTIAAGIPLKLSLQSDTDISLLAVKIMNVPGDAVLTHGTRRNDGVWVLQPGELANVALVMSTPRKTPLRLNVELVEIKTGELLSPTREIRVAVTEPKPFKVGGLDGF